MKHTLIIGLATLALSACTCTCPEKQYDLQYVQPNYQPSRSIEEFEFLPPSHMMTNYISTQKRTRYARTTNFNANLENNMNREASIEYRRYTQIQYIEPQEEYQYPGIQYQQPVQYQQPQQTEIIYYPVYQPMPAQPKYQDNCGCQQYNPCGC